MSFTDLSFLTLLVVVYALWLTCRRHYRATICLLLTSSLVFYGYHQRWLLALLLAYCIVNWAVGCWLARPGSQRRLAVSLGVAFNLVVLGYWKYTPLVLRSLASLFYAVDGPGLAAPPDDWAIPFGISFYAFTGIAYMVDVYRGTVAAETNFWRYTLWAVFFPHLVAGPILRPHDLLTKLQPDALPARTEAAHEVLLLLARGYFKKMVLADRIALAIDPFFTHVAGPSTAGAWSLPFVYLYALQIYFDFSGYTDIARGLGLMFGFRWPENFNLPYLATSVQDFWRRWHITLSQFLRDYLYVSLGGNRGGWLRTNANLMLTMLLGGLWHGASWSFLVWGGLHGAFLIVHRAWQTTSLARRLRDSAGIVRWAWTGIAMLLTFHAVCLAWCFFRLTAWRHSVACVRKAIFFDTDLWFTGGAADPALWLLLAAYGLGAALALNWQRLPRLSEIAGRPAWQPVGRGVAWGVCVALLILAAVLSPGGEKPPFIYFQF
jgi:alginate O-acetyltransferase complex protein AlgI